MPGQAIYDKLHNAEFRPFRLVLANGESVEVRHRDSLTLSSGEFRGKRVFASYLTLLETRENDVVERTISLPMVAQLVDAWPLNGHNGH
jgi:hypothetical protein